MLLSTSTIAWILLIGGCIFACIGGVWRKPSYPADWTYDHKTVWLEGDLTSGGRILVGIGVPALIVGIYLLLRLYYIYLVGSIQDYPSLIGNNSTTIQQLQQLLLYLKWN